MINIDTLMATPGSLTGGRTYKEVLEAARKRLDNSDVWTQEAFARDSSGAFCKPRDPRACCWCMMGAIACESNQYGIIPPPLTTFLEQVMAHRHGTTFESLGAMNDYVSHDVILDFLDTALAQFPPESQ